MQEGLAFALALAVLLVPGWSIVRALGVRGARSVVYAPALTALLMFIASAVGTLTGIRWTLWFFGACAFVSALGTWGVRAWALKKHSGERRSDTRTTHREAPIAVGLGVLVVSALAIGYGALGAMGGIRNLNGAYDAFYHYSAIAMIRDNGDAFAWTAMRDMYGGASEFYPTTFDALAALMPFDPVMSANAVLLAVLSLIPVTFFGVALVVIERVGGEPASAKERLTQWGLAASIGLATLGFSSPAMIGLVIALWPFLLGISLLPAAVATLADSHAGALRFLAPAGVFAAHPSAFISYLVVLWTALLAWALRSIFTGTHKRRAWLALVLLIGVGVGYVFTVSLVFGDMNLTKQAPHTTATTILTLVADRPRVRAMPFAIFGLVGLYALAFTGLIAGGPWRKARETATGAALLLCASTVLTFSCQEAEGHFAMLAAPWYGARERVHGLWEIGIVVLAGVGAAFLFRVLTAERFKRRAAQVASLSFVLIVALTVGGLGLTGALLPHRLPRTASLAYTAWGEQLYPYVTAQERDFIEAEAAKLPPEAVVLGSPLDGTTLFYSLGGRGVVYPSLAPPQTLDQRRIGRYASELSPSDAVCTSILREGVTHVYLDESEFPGSRVNARASRAFEGISSIPERYLHLVAEENGYRLYSLELPCYQP